jgi:uncharacterized protein
VYALDVVVIIAVVCLLFGLGLGVLLGRLWLPKHQETGLQERLNQAQAELENYQHQVAKHFVETSARIGDLTQSYKALHQHLAQGAANLASPDISRSLLEAATPAAAESASLVDAPTHLEPPKDWAPKVPGQKGALSEDFDAEDSDPRPGVFGQSRSMPHP